MRSLPVATAVPHGLAAWIGVVQFFFVTTWTVYVIYLPALAEPEYDPQFRGETEACAAEGGLLLCSSPR